VWTVPKNLLLVFILLFSIGIPFVGSRYGVRVEQLFIYGFAIAFLPYFFLKSNVLKNKYILLVGIFFIIFLPIYLKITNSLSYYSVYQGFFRIFGFSVLGYLFANYYSYAKFYKGVIGLSFVFLVFAYFQMYHIFSFNNIFRILYDGGIEARLYDQLPTTVFGLAEYTSSFILFSFVPFYVYFLDKNMFNKIVTIPILFLFIYFFIISEARSALVATIYMIFFYFLLRNSLKHKNKFFNISLFFAIIGIVSTVYFYQVLINSEDLLEKSLYLRLKVTWAKPIIDWLSSPMNFIYGFGLNNNYADSGYTSFLGAFGLLGFTLFYLPIILLVIELKKDYIRDKYLTYFYYTTILLLIVNITYPVFTGGKFADIYWLMFGATVKYLIYYKKELRNKAI